MKQNLEPLNDALKGIYLKVVEIFNSKILEASKEMEKKMSDFSSRLESFDSSDDEEEAALFEDFIVLKKEVKANSKEVNIQVVFDAQELEKRLLDSVSIQSEHEVGTHSKSDQSKNGDSKEELKPKEKPTSRVSTNLGHKHHKSVAMNSREEEKAKPHN